MYLFSVFGISKIMKIALCQINPIVGSIDSNVYKILEFYNKAVINGSDIVVFRACSPYLQRACDEAGTSLNDFSCKIHSIPGDLILSFGS